MKGFHTIIALKLRLATANLNFSSRIIGVLFAVLEVVNMSDKKLHFLKMLSMR